MFDSGRTVTLARFRRLTASPGRRIGLAAATGAVAKVLSLAAQILAVAIAYRVLHVQGFAIFVTIVALVSWLSLASLGVAPGVTLGIARAAARADALTAARLFSVSLLLAAVVAAGLVLIALPISAAAGVGERLGQSFGADATDAGSAVALMIGFVAAQLLLAVPEAAQLGLQSQYLTNMWAAAGSALTLLLLGAVGPAVTSVTAFVALSQGPQILARALNGLTFVAGHRYLLRPHGLQVRSLLRPVVGSGVAFAAIQLASYVSLQFGLLVVAGTSKAASVSLAGIILRAITVASGPVALLTAPTWPTVTDAASRGDNLWVGRIYRRVLTVTTGYACLIAFAIFFGAEQALTLWTGQAIHLDLPIQVLLAAYFILGVISHVSALTLVGLGLLRFTATVLIIEAALVAALMLILIPIIGVLGYVAALAVGTAAISAWLLPLRARNEISKVRIS
ncbi:MAG: hypothetical protein M3067_13965 [Chloroflexota bacterium]|nr:hypothetical protein [Chloroflexota bacterium]